MDSNSVKNKTHGQTTAHDDWVKDSSVLEKAQSLWNELRELSHDHFRLVALEMRQAGESLVTMIVMGVMIAVLLCAAWMGFLVAVVLKLIENGIVTSNAILLVVVFNLLIAVILCGVIRSKSYYLQFPATLRSLQPIPQKQRDTGQS